MSGAKGKLLRTKVRYTLKRPDKVRRTFSVIEDRKPTGPGKRSQKRLDDARIDAINASYVSGQIEYKQAEIELKKLIEDLYAIQAKGTQAPIHSFNRKTAEDYYEKHVAVRPLKDPRTEFNKLMRAVVLLGNDCSLRTATQTDIQKKVNKLSGNPQKKAITAINSLLYFIGRTEIELYAKDDEEMDLEYVTEEEFEQLVGAIPDSNLKTMLTLAFGTGARVGELIGLQAEDLQDRNGIPTIYIQRQKIRPSLEEFNDGKSYRLPKGKKKRHVAPLNRDTIAAFKKWVAIPVEKREQLRDPSSKTIHATAKKLWIDKTRTHAGIHMMRKSHCLMLLQKGAGVSLAARQLGDSEAVVQKHYAGFIHTDASIQALQKLLG